MANFSRAGLIGCRSKSLFAAWMIVFGLTAATWYYGTPKYTRVGYQPIQPVPFPHDIHVSQLGMDCRYCHSFVDVAAHSNLPNTQTCMNCHTQVQKDNPKLNRCGRVGKRASRSSGCRCTARPITCFIITQPMSIAGSVVSVATAKSIVRPDRRDGAAEARHQRRDRNDGRRRDSDQQKAAEEAVGLAAHDQAPPRRREAELGLEEHRAERKAEDEQRRAAGWPSIRTSATSTASASTEAIRNGQSRRGIARRGGGWSGMRRSYDVPEAECARQI